MTLINIACKFYSFLVENGRTHADLCSVIMVFLPEGLAALIQASCLQGVLAYIRTLFSNSHLYFVPRTAAENIEIPFSPGSLWTLMGRKQLCWLAVCSSAFLGLWIPLFIDDTGINLFIPAHLWKIHACSKYLSPWMVLAAVWAHHRP